jgi:hypothetical protein
MFHAGLSLGRKFSVRLAVTPTDTFLGTRALATKSQAPALNDDPFSVLGLSREASEREIKTAHRKLVMR